MNHDFDIDFVIVLCKYIQCVELSTVISKKYSFRSSRVADIHSKRVYVTVGINAYRVGIWDAEEACKDTHIGWATVESYERRKEKKTLYSQLYRAKRHSGGHWGRPRLGIPIPGQNYATREVHCAGSLRYGRISACLAAFGVSRTSRIYGPWLLHWTNTPRARSLSLSMNHA